MKSDFKLFLRNLWRNKLYSGVTVLGFALALMFVILLTAYIRQELSVDQFQANKDRIFRCRGEGTGFGPLIGGLLKNKYPEIESYTRTYLYTGFVDNGQHERIAYQALIVDSSFFKMFSFRLLAGDPSEVFRSKNSVVLSRKYALKLFGNVDVVGKELFIDNSHKLQITGIIEDFKNNTHFNPCDFFMNFNYLGDLGNNPQLLTTNANSSFGLYLMTCPGTNLSAKVGEIIDEFKKYYWLYKRGYRKEFHLEPLTEVYWSDHNGWGVHSNNKTFVLVLMTIVVGLLILAIINYNNLSLARAGFRAKEAAIKKLMGVSNATLFKQFVTESIALSLFAFLMAVFWAYWIKPFFNQALDTDIDITGLFSAGNWVWVLLAIVCFGGISGIVPAWIISRFNPLDVTKGGIGKKIRGIYGKVLICFQYVVTIILLVCTIVTVRQTQYLQNFDLGFDKDHVVWLENRVDARQYASLRSEFMKIPEVRGVSFVCGDPMSGGSNNSFDYKDKPVSFQEFRVDTAFFRLMNLRVTPTGLADNGQGVYLNETAVKVLELGKNALEVRYVKDVLPILGIVNDFYFMSLFQPIGPAIIMPIKEEEAQNVLIKMDDRNTAATYQRIKDVYAAFIDGVPFESGFMDETINQFYAQNERMARLIGYFAVVSIVLSMMGILAMATYFIHQRIKEIGLRRVNGATVEEILRMLLWGFMKWVILAFVLACPIAWWIMESWLQDYPHRIALSWWMFVLVGGLVILIALIMVARQSFKAAVMNPANSLKKE